MLKISRGGYLITLINFIKERVESRARSFLLLKNNV